MGKELTEGTKMPAKVWWTWVGDFITAAVLLATLAVGWGRITTEIEQLKQRQIAIEQSNDAARRELKEDVNRRLDMMHRTLERIDDKLDRNVILRRPTP